jgi:hypothetical protein
MSCCISLVNSVESMMMHGLETPKFINVERLFCDIFLSALAIKCVFFKYQILHLVSHYYVFTFLNVQAVNEMQSWSCSSFF